MSETNLIIRELGPADRGPALDAINSAARWYREFLPPEELHEPEMTPEDFDAESARMTWLGACVGGTLVGVMGLEYVRDTALLRHAYILEAHQRRGVGFRLAERAERLVRRDRRDVRRIVVGTYARNFKARGALERLGYALSADSEALLGSFYDIPEHRLANSVTYEKHLS